MAPPNEHKLKILEGQRQTFFQRLQIIYDLSRADLSDTDKLEDFLCSIETLDEIRSNYQHCVKEINSLVLKFDINAEPEFNQWLAFEDLYCRIKRRQSQVEPPPAVSPVKQSVKDNTSPNFKLAKIEIPEFDGTLRDWPLFYATFQNAVHTNGSLTDTERMFYLANKLKGKARSIFIGVTPSADNYTAIYRNLIERYEDRRNLAASYLDQLFSLKPITSVTADNLENLIDQFSNSYHALNNLKINDLSDFIMSHSLLKRLDKETAQQFEMENRHHDIPSFQNLVVFVRDRIKILKRTNDKVTANYNKTSRSFVVSEARCALCNDTCHAHLYSCSKFKGMSPRERYVKTKDLQACVSCLSLSHQGKSCMSTSGCKVPGCGSKRHHTLLHFPNSSNANSLGGDGPKNSASLTEPVSNEHTTKSSPFCSMSSKNSDSRQKNNNNKLLGTALADVRTADGSIMQVRLLIDPGSEISLCSRSACKRLGIRVYHGQNDESVVGIGGISQPTVGTTNATLLSKHNKSFSLPVQMQVINKIAGNLPSGEFDVSSLTYLKGLQLADPRYFIPSDIDILLGSEFFAQILGTGKILGPPGQPDALETIFGYIILGSIADIPTASNNTPRYSFFARRDSIETLMTNFLQLESVPTLTHISDSDKECETFYETTTKRDINTGRYIVGLPFKQPPSKLGNSMNIASRCLSSLDRKFQTNPALKTEYDNTIRDYLDRQILSAAPASTASDVHYVIPHHAVLRKDKPLRIVLNASQSCDNGVSLNDILHSGANLQADLTAIILKFRLFPVAMTADIKQMFLAIGVREEDRRFLNILYKFDTDEHARLYQFNRVCFGLRCSPYLAMRTVKQLAKDESDLPLASQVASRNLYMDDLGVSVPTAKDGVQLASDLIQLFKRGGFDLVKFVSNSPEVLKAIPENNRLSSKIEFDHEDNMKLLGLIWSPTEDEFSISLKFNPQTKCTKRMMLSTIARLWDINGYCAPVILYAKLLIKALWSASPKIDWDDTPPRDICSAWNRFLTELPVLQKFKIPRFLGILPDSRVYLLGFADASEKAMGASVYLCAQHSSGMNDVHLVAAKSKVALLKSCSLARLELTAIVLLSKLLRFVIDVVASCRPIDEIFAFSDSTVALHWVHSSPHRFDTFVANRIALIQDNLDPKHFFHCESAHNPSDCISRGLTPAQLLDHPLWLHGPPWARDPVHTWPISRFIFDPAQDEKLLELKKQSHVFLASEESAPFLCEFAKRFSSWSKLLRVVVYMYRFLGKLPRSERMLPSHLEFAETAIIKALQGQYFSEDIKALSKNRKISKSIIPLSPFLKNDILRVGGRLDHSSLEYNSKHPILLPKRDHIVNLIIDYFHRKYLHAGPQLLLSILRQKYWIVSGRSVVKQRFRLCNTCFKVNPRTESPYMAALPAPRVNESKAFLYTGCDYTSAFDILISRYRGARREKAYICLFTCLQTRAVHLEAAVSLSCDSFLRAFRRFISRRGKILSLFSDNGSNFLAARNQFKEINDFLKSKTYQDSFEQEATNHGITWHLNPPAASHFGGCWESQIRVVKTHLRRAIGDTLLTYEEFMTVLAQVEAVMNSRPLTALSSDPAEPEALTPAHFLTQLPLETFHTDPRLETADLVKSKQLVDEVVQRYWKRWRREYLNTLQSRAKWNTKSNPVVKGTVVLLKTENSPPLQWPLGIIEDIMPASDGVVRVVVVRTQNGTYVRPVVKLCVLPTQ